MINDKTIGDPAALTDAGRTMGTSTSRTTTRSWRTFVTKDRLAFDRADYLGAKIIPGILAPPGPENPSRGET